MKKTIGIITILVSVVFTTAFGIAVVRKNSRKKSITKSELTEQGAHESLNSSAAKKQQNPLFYTSAGGSSPDKATEINSPKTSSRFTIEIANLTSQSEAETLLLNLKSKGIDGFYTPVRRGGEVYYRVRIGMFSNAEDAQKNLSKIAAAVKIKGTVSKLQ